jgi:hypothetical protein
MSGVKPIKKLETILHFKKNDYVYRYVLVDRFKHTANVHYGFDINAKRTEEEIWQMLISNRKLRRKYILKNDS